MNIAETVFIDGLSIRCAVYRDHPGTPWIVFSNSLITDMRIWAAQVERFRSEYQILCYDQRGHGGTPASGDRTHFDRLASDVLGLLDHFEISTCNFTGISMGTPTGLALYKQAPERVSRLILSDGQAKPTSQGVQLWEERLTNVLANGYGEYVSDTLGRWFGEPYRVAFPDQIAAFEQMMRATSLDGFSACVRALQNFDYSDVLEDISVPTLVAVGANDGNLPNVMRTMANRIPNSRFVEIEGAGHMPQIEQAKSFNAALAEFLDRS